MNVPPNRSLPTPQMAPAVAGMLQGLLTGFLFVKAGLALGLNLDAAIVISGALVSSITSVFYRVAQAIHWG